MTDTQLQIMSSSLPLLSLLASESPSVREQAVASLWDLVAAAVLEPAQKTCIIIPTAAHRGDALLPLASLIRTLEMGSAPVRKHVAEALRRSALGIDIGPKAEFDLSYLSALVRLLDSNPGVQAAAATVLNRISLAKGAGAKIAAAGALGPLVGLLSSSSDTVAQEQVLGTLINISEGEETQDFLVKAGAISHLSKLQAESISVPIRQQADRLLARLMDFSAPEQNATSADFFPTLISSLGSSSPAVQKDAIEALISYMADRDNRVKLVQRAILAPLSPS